MDFPAVAAGLAVAGVVGAGNQSGVSDSNYRTTKSMWQIFLTALLLSTLLSCGQKLEDSAVYPLQVGDIPFDPKVDDPNFKLCDEGQILQYYNFSKGFQYQGEKVMVNQHFEENFKAGQNPESGFLTIRFVVNCEGKTGRYRVQGMTSEYIEKKFDDKLVTQLLSLTKQLDGWGTGEYDGKKYDYYQYLTFKIENGRLIEIMP